MNAHIDFGMVVTHSTGAINHIAVSGYKSILSEQRIELRGLTLLAGANSSGKSSIMQPLLLLKQTLEETYDPGPLLLHGPNVKFTTADQFLSRTGKDHTRDTFSVAIGVEHLATIRLHFTRRKSRGISISQMMYSDEDSEITLHPKMSSKQIVSSLPEFFLSLSEDFKRRTWVIKRNRCFLELGVTEKTTKVRASVVLPRYSFTDGLAQQIRNVIHVPASRAHAERSYPVTAIGKTFPGTFQTYVASLISKWQLEKKGDRLRNLNADLEKLQLSRQVMARRINDAHLELRVPRLADGSKRGDHDLINIADVGFGVSQTLPVLVALEVAEEGQIVYVEEPEIHLHPRAQFSIAQVIANAAKRGVRVVIETHSPLILLGIQTLVAEGKLSSDSVKLYWFQRRNGETHVQDGNLDESGAFGEWPEDFSDVILKGEGRFLDAAESRRKKK